jgi:hypothetical protein
MKSSLISKDLKTILANFGILTIISEDMDYLDAKDESTITYMPIDKVSRSLESGKDPWTATSRVAMKVGRFFNKILFIEDSKIENLANRFKTFYKISKGDFSEIFTIVHGEDIRFWYNVANYVPGGGSLNSSCMRGATTQLDLYVENPDVVKLLIMTENNKLSGRALMWTTDRGVYIDRPYCRYDTDQHMYKKYAEHFKYHSFYTRTGAIQARARLRKTYDSAHKPYLDSMQLNGRDITVFL